MHASTLRDVLFVSISSDTCSTVLSYTISKIGYVLNFEHPKTIERIENPVSDVQETHFVL
jgi:hypothetical protein